MHNNGRFAKSTDGVSFFDSALVTGNAEGRTQGHVSLRKQRTFRYATTDFPARNDVWEMTAESVTKQIRAVILIGRTAREIFFSQSEALPRSVISMEFLQSFLRRYFSQGETSGDVPKCQEFAQVRAMYGIYLLSLKIFHLHFFAWLRNCFCFYVFFFLVSVGNN